MRNKVVVETRHDVSCLECLLNPMQFAGLVYYKFYVFYRVARLIEVGSSETFWQLLLPEATLAQLGERRSAEREVAGSNPGRSNTQGL